jgi:hypothetical protein
LEEPEPGLGVLGSRAGDDLLASRFGIAEGFAGLIREVAQVVDTGFNLRVARSWLAGPPSAARRQDGE